MMEGECKAADRVILGKLILLTQIIDLKIKYSVKFSFHEIFQFFFCSFHRPILVILDRQVDLATPLHHTWTYQALAHDVLHYSLNRVSLGNYTFFYIFLIIQKKL